VPGDSLKDFVLDQLAALPGLRARAMFGGHGLYAGAKFFGILFEGRLYFKVSARTRGAYEARGMGPFTYQMPARTITMSYYEVPADVLENREEVIAWARAAMHVCAAKSPAKPGAGLRRRNTSRLAAKPRRVRPA
jgi:DNA transformation protein